MVTKIKPATKIMVKETLLNIEVGTSVFIKTKVMKPSSIRSAIRFLKKEGYDLRATERGLVDQVKVSRYK